MSWLSKKIEPSKKCCKILRRNKNWNRSYLSSNKVTAKGLLEYVQETKDLQGALRYLFRVNMYCKIINRFEWNLVSNADFCKNDRGYEAYKQFRKMKHNDVTHSAYSLCKLVMLYMYISAKSQAKTGLHTSNCIDLIVFNKFRCFTCEKAVAAAQYSVYGDEDEYFF
uniref:Uncharacterized protein n=1 Tax=Spodoptera frugiperda nuclear polyhedrosis virus TaxID=10455 RepID=A0A0R5RHT2_NPVSF|nr:hypothetical protein [Spodoptera frugiperda multiple nucleopolyhedrovirus]